ncbi:hypothetical protein [Caldicellulosiruptor morganii]|uniref:DUF2092 domain-containing protein n=1 Tax=Caldicellulosiruptor morganii TaxID=1387555 RepID=A0ABY7BN61_9FIRM|nr:hypothetical protein [Caldicellulosiruptor morganii]WAM34287.1 DUF2092 domain-containing protein [Caldicellulosiruptor morganii]
MKGFKKIFCVVAAAFFLLFNLSSFAIALQTSSNSLKTSFKSELSRLLNVDTPISCDIITTSRGQKSLGFGVNIAVNKTNSYKISADRKNKRFFVYARKGNLSSTTYVNGQKVYTLDTKDNKYVENIIPSSLWLSINMLDMPLSQNQNKFNQAVLSYLSSQASSIIKGAYKAKTLAFGKNVDCYVLTANLPGKILEPAVKNLLISNTKTILSQLSPMIDLYLKTLTDEEKQALKSLNVDPASINADQITKLIENAISSSVNSLKLDDYRVSFYLDQKTNKIVKIIIKNIPANSNGVSSRVEISNILTGNDVKFPQISQAMIKSQSSQLNLAGILKLLEDFVSKIQQLK